jgi:L-cysteine desulfidase
LLSATFTIDVSTIAMINPSIVVRVMRMTGGSARAVLRAGAARDGLTATEPVVALVGKTDMTAKSAYHIWHTRW